MVAIAVTVPVPRPLLRYFSTAETEKILVFSDFGTANIFLSCVINPAARSAGHQSGSSSV
jgi:hypothetical protein